MHRSVSVPVATREEMCPVQQTYAIHRVLFGGLGGAGPTPAQESRTSDLKRASAFPGELPRGGEV